MAKKLNVKDRVWEIVNAAEREDKPEQNLNYFDIFIISLILLNAVAVILETGKSFE